MPPSPKRYLKSANLSTDNNLSNALLAKQVSVRILFFTASLLLQNSKKQENSLQNVHQEDTICLLDS
jgi:hypothetical protein